MGSDRASEVFSQQAVTQELRRRILTAQYAAGQRIPPERELLEEFGCSRLTVAKAMAPLVAEGLIARHQGRGTFVTGATSHTVHRGPVGRANGRPTARGNVIKYLSPGQESSVRGSRDDVLGGLHAVLDGAGYHVSVDFYSSLDEHLRCLERMRDPQIAGVVLWPAPAPRTVALIESLIAGSVPLVLIDTYLPGVDCDFVVTDNIEGAAGMVGHLAGLGHRRLCYLTEPTQRTSLRDRLAGFLRGMVEAELPIDDGSVVRVDLDCLRGEGSGKLVPVLKTLLARPAPPTALFASHDYLAIAIRQCLAELGVRVPQALSVAGFDGIEASSFGTPALTTVEQDFRSMAMDAARILMERFDGRPAPLRHQRYILPHLRARASTSTISPPRPEDGTIERISTTTQHSPQ